MRLFILTLLLAQLFSAVFVHGTSVPIQTQLQLGGGPAAAQGLPPTQTKAIRRRKRGIKTSGLIAGALIGTGAAVGANAYKKYKAKNG
ncbi:hypothetical protein niasHT_037942 [Heterodera trifolii]|uniref:Uncharacterized protein n=1 Tax=Heterodera trifolii TaxID=157864 RepID=A0ABD2HRY1_9BILA